MSMSMSLVPQLSIRMECECGNPIDGNGYTEAKVARERPAWNRTGHPEPTDTCPKCGHLIIKKEKKMSTGTRQVEKVHIREQCAEYDAFLHILAAEKKDLGELTRAITRLGGDWVKKLCSFHQILLPRQGYSKEYGVQLLVSHYQRYFA